MVVKWNEMISSIVIIVLLFHVIHGRPLIRPMSTLDSINGSNRIRSQQKQYHQLQHQQQHHQQLTLFPDERVEDIYKPFSIENQKPARTIVRHTRHSKVLFPDDKPMSERSSLSTIKRLTNTQKTNSSIRRNLNIKRNETQVSLIKSDSLIECINSGKIFCDEYPNEYTLEYVERIVKRDTQNYNNFFSDSKTITTINSPDLVTGLSGQRSYSHEEKYPLCASKRTTVYPKFARDIDGDWNPIINTDKHRQAVQMDLCGPQSTKSIRLNESNDYNEIVNFGNLFKEVLPTGFRPKCTQRYQTYVLLTVSKGQIDKRVFKVPSYCEFEVLRYHYD